MKRLLLTLAFVACAVPAIRPASAPRAMVPALHAPLVASSRVVETTISLALINPTRPAGVAGEAEILASDVNGERAKHGLQALSRDAALDRIAAAKASDMGSREYFGHTDPQGVTFQDRMRAANWPTVYVAENIAFDRDEAHANLAFVNSPGHYANIVDPNESRIGVAVATVGRGENFYVEVFSGR